MYLSLQYISEVFALLGHSWLLSLPRLGLAQHHAGATWTHLGRTTAPGREVTTDRDGGISGKGETIRPTPPLQPRPVGPSELQSSPHNSPSPGSLELIAEFLGLEQDLLDLEKQSQETELPLL